MWFRFKLIANAQERTLGLAIRFLGVDISLLLLGWINEWRLVDLRLPCNYGIYCQVLFGLLSIGRLQDATIYENPS